MKGGPGNDHMSGDVGNDVLTGGEGADIFYYTANGNFMLGGFGGERITDFDPSGRDHDQLIMLINRGFGVNNFADLRAGMQMHNGDTIMNFGGGDVIILQDVRINELHANDFQIFGF